MPAAFITGVTGQDGSYLAELLLTKGYSVFGATRNIENARLLLPASLVGNIELVALDMHDQYSVIKILDQYKPTEIYNCAAYSSGAEMFVDPVGIGEINGLAVSRILKAIHEVNRNIRFCQAGSSELFGKAFSSPQSENTPFQPRSPYGAAKLYAHSMIQIYREYYGLFACSAILFNHESPRRGLGFVTRKITHTAAKIKLGLEDELCLGNLEARRDWGFAGDYVRAMWLMLQKTHATDYVVATGETHSVRDLCEIAFSHLGLDYRDFVREDKTIYRALEPLQLVGDSAMARTQLNWKPELGFREMVRAMVDADFNKLAEQGKDND
jgi:GDPmannose 4,6-dehydratase